MNKKIYIITFHRSCSHGALLQCYASQSFFKSLGYDAVILDYRNKAIEEEYRIIKKIDFSRGFIILAKSWAFQLLNLPFYIFKKSGFASFRRKYLSLSSKKIVDSSEISLFKDSDAFFAGSDQIWNGDITGGLDDIYFLNFPTNALKASLAASIGKDSLTAEETIKINDLVSRIDLVTVREEKTKKLIINLDKPVNVICDPVFLPEKDHWINMIKKRKYKGNRFILIYALSYDIDISKMAKELSKEKGLKVISIARNYCSNDGVGKKVYANHPDDLLFYIFHSDIVLTNSFHGVALSIVLRKDFIAFSPIKRSIRITELLEKCGLETRLYSESNDVHKFVQDLRVNYSLVDDKINRFADFGRKVIIDSLEKIK